ncbi:MAG: glucosamine-6-phosphate deaminase [Bacillaceae bacterium]|nr:glucosamine-6-phosphate deaminase [Bacillaceae bacterium]
MKIIKAMNYEEMSQLAADRVIDRVRSHPHFTLGLATGATPLGLYNKLVGDHQKNGTSYQGVVTFNLDEYIGLPPNHPNSYHYYMNQHLFDHIDIEEKNIHLPDGTAENLVKECIFYEKQIRQAGGIRLQILGIGQNGHIGFNEPGTSPDSRTHVVRLTESTRKANSHYFKSMEEVPACAITMGLATIIESEEIILLASGEHKSSTIDKLIHGDVHHQFPASLLKTHPNVTVIADQAALKMARAPRVY